MSRPIFNKILWSRVSYLFFSGGKSQHPIFILVSYQTLQALWLFIYECKTNIQHSFRGKDERKEVKRKGKKERKNTKKKVRKKKYVKGEKSNWERNKMARKDMQSKGSKEKEWNHGFIKLENYEKFATTVLFLWIHGDYIHVYIFCPAIILSRSYFSA